MRFVESWILPAMYALRSQVPWSVRSASASPCVTKRGKVCSMNIAFPNTRKLIIGTLLLAGLLTMGTLPFFSRERVKYETIEATAMGTGSQLGANFGVSLEIYDYSTPEDRQVLIQAFEKAQNQGLVNALSRQLRFGEVYWDTQSTAFNLTGGEFDLNDQDKSKSGGVLLPLAQLAIDKEGQLQIELNQNAWRLVDVLDWKGTPGVN